MLDFNDAKTDNLKLNYKAIWGGNGPSYNIPFLINDVRIYDHALSPLEIKEISQGLILHYPLNRGGWGNDNILINSNFDLRYTQSSGWDTTKNGTQLASSWGGYNGGVSNPSTVYHAHLKELNGEWVYEYIKTASETWLGISQGGLNSKLTAGKPYTFSWEQYCVSGSNYVQTGLYYFKTGATSANFHLGLIYGNVDRELGKWQKFSRTFIAPEDGDYSKNMSWYIYGYSGNGIVYVRHPKLEEGNTATPWSPSPSDALATTMGLNDNIEYDASGYCNNGTRTGTFSWTSDTPRYSVSTYMSKATLITHPCPVFGGTDQEWSCAMWVKLDTTSQTNQYMNNFNGGNQIVYMANSYPLLYLNSGTNDYYNYGNKAVTAGTWTHVVFVFKNSNATKLIYINGVEQTNKNGPNKTSTPLGIPDTVIVGTNLAGYISDYRIYATALSAEDVKSLYQNSAYIDNQGNIYGAVYEEV